MKTFKEFFQEASLSPKDKQIDSVKKLLTKLGIKFDIVTKISETIFTINKKYSIATNGVAIIVRDFKTKKELLYINGNDINKLQKFIDDKDIK